MQPTPAFESYQTAGSSQVQWCSLLDAQVHGLLLAVQSSVSLTPPVFCRLHTRRCKSSVKAGFLLPVVEQVGSMIMLCDSSALHGSRTKLQHHEPWGLLS